MSPMPHSIRFRLTACYVAALALTLLLLGGSTFLLTRASLYHWLGESLAERAEALQVPSRRKQSPKAKGNSQVPFAFLYLERCDVASRPAAPRSHPFGPSPS